MRRLFLLIGFLLFIVQSASAVTFTVRRIQVQGNQRLGSTVVLTHVPLHVGQRFDAAKSASIIQSLFKSGYFSDARLLRRGNTLIVRVKEYPIISKLTFSGNKKIDNKKLKPILKQLKLQVGDTYHPEKLSELREGLIQAYKNLGRYAVAITLSVRKHAYNTVVIHVKVEEGVTTKVHAIHFSGNHAFSSHELREQFHLTTSGLFTFFTHHDRFSPFQLDRDLADLENFYFNHGYLEFRVLSKRADFSPDKKRVDISINVHEGPVYHLSGYKIEDKYAKNPGILHIFEHHHLHAGQVFSRVQIMGINSEIANYFADRGYAFPKVNAVPRLDRARKMVFLTFVIKPGRRVYVRFIHVAGNGRTTEKALRYQMRQLEGSAYSLKDIKESRRRIANLPYFKDIQVTPQPVPGAPNQVDLNYNVKEQSSGRASVQGGYSDVDGLLYGASISEPNFMGTGKYVSLGFQNSSYAKQYSLGYSNPFFTSYGMSRGFNVFYTHMTPNHVSLDTYTMDNYGLDINYSLPISEYDYMTFGYGYSHVAIGNIIPVLISPGAFQSLLLHSSPYNNFTGTLGFGHSNLDRGIFPTKGNFQNISAQFGVPIIKSSLAYYKVGYTGRWYIPTGPSGFIIHPHLALGYGNGYGNVNSLPFFLNYYGGGIDTLPGYEANTLGPKNPNDFSNSVGGNVEVFGGLNLIFPNGISDRVRTSLFIDFGNVFQTHKTAGNPGNPTVGPTIYENVKLSNLRWSAGLLVSWNSPFGVISVGYGIPFNVKPGDQVGQFGFTFGTSL